MDGEPLDFYPTREAAKLELTRISELENWLFSNNVEIVPIVNNQWRVFLDGTRIGDFPSAEMARNIMFRRISNDKGDLQ